MLQMDWMFIVLKEVEQAFISSTWFSHPFTPNDGHIDNFFLFSRESPEDIEGAGCCFLTRRRLWWWHWDQRLVSLLSSWVDTTITRSDEIRCFYPACHPLSIKRCYAPWIGPMIYKLWLRWPIKSSSIYESYLEAAPLLRHTSSSYWSKMFFLHSSHKLCTTLLYDELWFRPQHFIWRNLF